VLEFKQMVVWDKGPIGMGWHYRRSYETILVAMKPGSSCAWYDTTNKVENIVRSGFKGIKKIIPSANDHPTVKPVNLAAHFIKLHSKPDDIVLDVFAGSGTTLEAALKLGRQYIGIELDPDYCRMAEERIKREKEQLNMFYRGSRS
jgi:site-specific DNA-methyltransferase (adenine-specific)